MARKWKPQIVEPPPARGFVAASFDDTQHFSKVRAELESRFGTVDYETEAIHPRGLPSAHGELPRRNIRFLSFDRPVGREELVDMKRRCLALEYKYQQEGRPLIELDPGYVAGFTVVSTSLQDDFHRIYLYGGVYAETLYYFEKFSFRPLIHTPEFYRQSDIITIFNDLRLIYTEGRV